MIALFRTTYDQHCGDPLFDQIVSALDAASGEFRDWWSSYRVATPSSGRKTLQPEGRTVTPFVYATLQANDDPALKLFLYSRAR